jgi:magnesium transporter
LHKNKENVGSIMQETIDHTNFTNEIEQILQMQNIGALHTFLDEQNISEIAEWMEENEEYAGIVISNLSINRSAAVFKILDLKIQKQLINTLPATKTAELINELPADDRTDLFEGLPSNVVRELIKTLDFGDRKVALSLLGYPENSVGRLMTPDYVYVYETDTMSDVIDTIRRVGKNSETIDVIYVINEKGELQDDIKIRDIILSPPAMKVKELMDGRVITLHAEDDQEIASDVFKMNNRVALPVVSRTNKLLGIVTIDDILWVAEEEFTEDMQKMGGTEALNEPYLDVSINKLVKKRASWLVVLFIGEMFTATAMQYFNKEIESATILALFIPLIVSSGGNSGSQASTLIIQAMALGEITVKDWWRIMRRELIAGLSLGLILGIIGFIRIVVWQNLHIYDYGMYWGRLSLVIFFSLTGIVLWGSIVGSMLPLLLKRLGADPATSSTPFVATLVDVTGLLIYFSIALLFLRGTLL